MNAERLHALAQRIRDELESTEQVQRLNQLVEALNNVVQQPQQAQHQQTVSQVRDQLRNALSVAPSNDFSPAWRQHLSELELDDLLGQQLLNRIEEVFSRNEITPASAAEELEPVRDRVGQLRDAVERTTDGLSALGVGLDQLDPGEFELGVLIPRAAVDNELGELGEEFIEVKKILLPLVELATGSRPGLTVRTISSTDFTTYLAAIPAVAACVAFTVERITSIYKNILEIRELHARLKNEQVPDRRLEGLREHVDELMSAELETLADELREEFGGHLEAERANELMREIRRSLNSIANRIDRGYNVEVRHEPLPPSEDEDTDDSEEPTGPDYSSMVLERLPGLQFINLTGDTILSLPEGGDAAGTPADGEEDGGSPRPNRTGE